MARKRACIFNVQLASLDGLLLFSAILQIMVCFIHAKCYNKYHESIPKQEYEKEHSSKDWGGEEGQGRLNLTKSVRATMKNNWTSGLWAYVCKSTVLEQNEALITYYQRWLLFF